MSRTLDLIGASWELIQSAIQRGNKSLAISHLRNLLARPDLPHAIAVEAHCLTSRILIEWERFASGRRHLRAAARLSPEQANLYYQRGLAHEQDPQGSDSLALRLHLQAVRLSPENATYRAAFGRACIRDSRLKRGIRELRAAAALAAGDLSVIRIVVEGFVEARYFRSAQAVINTASFLCRDSADSRELAKLGYSIRFHAMRGAQRRKMRQENHHRRDSSTQTVLPFTGSVHTQRIGAALAPDSSGKSRRDVVSLPRPHFPRFKVRRADR